MTVCGWRKTSNNFESDSGFWSLRPHFVCINFLVHRKGKVMVSGECVSGLADVIENECRIFNQLVTSGKETNKEWWH